MGKGPTAATTFFLKRLLKMEAAMGKNQKIDHMTRGEAQAFKDRWEVVKTAEKEELASTPMADKFPRPR